MKNILALVVAAATLASVTGCIVVPAHERYGGGYVAPAGVVYVAPTYAAPGPG